MRASATGPGRGRVVFAVVTLATVVGAALAADLLPLADPLRTGAGRPLAGPSLEHPFGTDQLGRDVLARVVVGSRTSIVVAVVAITVAFVVGGGLGLLAGLRRGATDTAMVAGSNVLLAVPPLIVAIAVVAVLGNGLINVALTIAAVSIAEVFRVTRGLTRSVSEREYVVASRMMGARSMRTMRVEILPAVLPSAAVFACIGAGVAVAAEGALSFLGLGVAPPQPSLGSVLSDGVGRITEAPHLTLVPALMIGLLVISLDTIAEHLRTRDSRIPLPHSPTTEVASP